MSVKFYNVLLRFPKIVVFFCILAICAAGYGARFIHFKSDNRMFFSPEDPQLLAFDALRKTYSKDDGILVVLTPKNGNAFTAENLAIVEKLTKDLWKTPYSTRVDSITNFQYTRANGDDLEVADLVKNAQQLSLDDVEKIRLVALSEPLLVNRLISPDGKVEGIYLKIDRPGKNQESETTEAAQFVRDLTQKVQAVNANFEVHFTGPIFLDASFVEASVLDLKTLTPAMLTIIAIALFLFLRSAAGTFAALLMMVLAIIAAVGLAGWIGIAFSPSSVPAPTILLTLAVADAVHVLTGYYGALNKGLNKQEAMVDSVQHNFSAIFFTNLTTAIGFLSMNFSDAPPFHDLGNITAIGVVVTYFLTVIFLPAMMMWFPAKIGRPDGAENVLVVNRIAAFVIRHKYKLIVINTALVVSLTYCATFNELDDNFVKYFDDSVQFRRDTDYASAHLTGVYSIDYSIVQGEEGGVNDPNFLKQVEAFVSWYRQQPEVRHVYSITDILKRLNMNMNADNPASYRLPENREMTAQYLLMYEMSLPYGLDLNDRINVNKASTRLTVALRDISSKSVIQLEERAQAWLAANATLLKESKGTGMTLMFAHISRLNILSMITGELVSMTIISLILMFLLRSIGLGLVSLIPNLVPAAMAFGIWGLVVGQVGLACSVVAAMTLGILIDDTVHFLSKYRYAKNSLNLQPEAAVHYAFSSVGNALWVTSAVLILGFSLFAFSSFKINYEMGLLTAIIFALGLFAEFILLPPVLLAFEDINRNLRKFFA